MSLENTNLSRRKLLRAGAIGVPAAGVLAFGSTLVTATSANAISADGWWGSETSAGFQRFMNTVNDFRRQNPLVVDGVISSQPIEIKRRHPGLIGGWEWVPDGKPADGSPTITSMVHWLNFSWGTPYLETAFVNALQRHYGISPDGRLDGPSQTIMALQNEINQYVG